MSKFPEREEFDDTSPSQETADRHRDDQLLRKFGFRIYSRPCDDEPIWRKDGITFKHSEALLRVYYQEINHEQEKRTRRDDARKCEGR